MSSIYSATQIPNGAPQRMSWHALLCPERLNPETQAYSKHRTAFEIDYDRLVFSKAFRRLARKTQVHPLALNDHTHNRLTHSLEVASVGRSLGKAACCIAKKHENQPITATATDFAELVQAACLAHDVGNTPFGHAGERAIRQWMGKHAEVYKNFNDAQSADLLLYEGNAQAFRIATHSVSGFEHGCDKKNGGLALSAATLATMMKYPWYSDHDNAQTEGKYSVFQADKSAFEWVVKTTGLLPRGEAYCRHPLAFMVEAADDICNTIIDIEDAIDLHILHRSDVEQFLIQLSGQPGTSTVAEMRSTSIKKLVQQCVFVFEHNYETIMQGQRGSPLIDDIDTELLNAFNALNDIAKNRVYPFEQNESLEQSCTSILARILSASIQGNTSIKASQLDSDNSRFDDFTKLIADTGEPTYERLMMIMDFVAGMTDNYAVNLADRLGQS